VIETVEPRIATLPAELADQRSSLKLIASENYASPAVLLTMGSWLSDKYAEGTIGHRFYAGCQNIDTVESHRGRARPELFGAEYAYLQPQSGIDANLVAFWAILAHRVELPELAELGVKGINEPQRGAVGDASAQVRQPARPGHVAGRRRPPDPRVPAEHLRQDVPPALVRHRSDHPAGRLRPGAPAAQGVQAADPDRRLLGLSAPDQLREMREIADESGATFMVDMAHFAGSGAARCSPATRDPVPHAQLVTSTTRTSRCAVRAAALVLATKEYVRFESTVACPLGARRPAAPRDGGEGRALAEAATPAVPDLSAGSPTTRRRSPRAAERGAPRWSPTGTDNTWC
jgi:glycine hydroxymethyltransferase